MEPVRCPVDLDLFQHSYPSADIQLPPPLLTLTIRQQHPYQHMTAEPHGIIRGRWKITAALALPRLQRQTATRPLSSLALPISAMFKRLKSKYLKCPLSTNRFLPVNVLDEEITEENVKAEIPKKLSNFLKPHLPSTVVHQARKVFAILVIVGEPEAIKYLLAEGITDEDLPLSRKDGDEDDNNLVPSSDNGKIFRSFADWEDERRVEYFLDKQWMVLAPVLDFSGRDMKLSVRSALPFQAVDPVGHSNVVTVYKSDVHPAHQRGLQVRHIPVNC